MKRIVAVVTRITGLDGSYQSELLPEKGYDVLGIVRRTSMFNPSRIDPTCEQAARAGELEYGDLGDPYRLNRILAKVRPDEMHNLAAESHVAVSFQQPEYTCNVDDTGVLRLPESIRAHRMQLRSSRAIGSCATTASRTECTRAMKFSSIASRNVAARIS